MEERGREVGPLGAKRAAKTRSTFLWRYIASRVKGEKEEPDRREEERE